MNDSRLFAMLRQRKYQIFLWSICYMLITLKGDVHSSTSSETSVGWKAGAAGDEEKGSFFTNPGQSYRQSTQKLPSQTDDQKESTPRISSDLMYNLDNIHDDMDHLHKIVQAIVLQQNDHSKKEQSEDDVLDLDVKKKGSKVDTKMSLKYDDVGQLFKGKEEILASEHASEINNTYSDGRVSVTINSTVSKDFNHTDIHSLLRANLTNGNAEKTKDIVAENKIIQTVANLTTFPFTEFYETTVPILDDVKSNENHLLSSNNNAGNNATEIIFSSEFLGEGMQTKSPLPSEENVMFRVTDGINDSQSILPESGMSTDSEIAESSDVSKSTDRNSIGDVSLKQTNFQSSVNDIEAALGEIKQADDINESDDLKKTNTTGSDEPSKKIKEYRSDDSASPMPITLYGDNGLEKKDNKAPFDSHTTSDLSVSNYTLSQNLTKYEVSNVTSNDNLSNETKNFYFPAHTLGEPPLNNEGNASHNWTRRTTFLPTHFQSKANGDGISNKTDSSDETILLENEMKYNKERTNYSSRLNSWKRICFQNVNEIRHSLEDNIIVLPEKKADIYLFYYIPIPKKAEEPILYLPNYKGKKFDGGYLKHRYTTTNDSYVDQKYSAFSLQHHKMIASYRQNKSEGRNRRSRRNANSSFMNKDPRFPYLWHQKNDAKKLNIDSSRAPKYFDSFPDSLKGNLVVKRSAHFKREVQKNNSRKPEPLNYYCTYLPFYNNETLKSRNMEEKVSGRVDNKADEENDGRNKRFLANSDSDGVGDDEEDQKSDERNNRYLADLHLDKTPPPLCDPPSKWCADRSNCITEKSWCNNIIDCLDKSDEINCSCKERMDKNKVCDGYFDCPNGEDEKGCYGCPENMFSCDDREPHATCVYMDQRCDYSVDCPNTKDERDCEILTETINSHDIFQASHTSGYLHRNWKGKWYPACTNAKGDEEWAVKACTSELGTLVKHVENEILPFFNRYNGQFISYDETGSVKFIDFCTNPGYAVHVTCPSITCGSRVPHVDFYAKYRAKRDTETSIQNLVDPFAEQQNCSDAANCSRARRSDGRVVGGQFSNPGRWPWLVALFKNGNFHCGGTILDETWIVSAAHCVRDHAKHYFEIQAGILRRFSFTTSEQRRMVTHVIMHPEFQQRDMTNDIALLKLDEPLKFNRWVRPICLPEAKSPWGPPAGTRCTAVGWGSVKEGGRDTDNMKEVILTVLPKCKHKVDRENDELCAGDLAGGKDTCQGDSGGPLLCKIPFSRDRWYVAGIVSHGEGCARPLEPGVYTRIALFLHWLLENTDDSLLTEIRKTKHECSGTKCSHGGRCISQKRVCDTVIDCLSAEDELPCQQFFQPGMNLPDSNAIQEIFKSAENNTQASQNNIYSLDEMKNGTTKGETNKTYSRPRSDDSDEILRSLRILPFSEDKNESSNFLCTVFHQVIPKTSYCNGEVDCEDGTDEVDCICRDFLKTYNHSLVCDGVIHCDDGSDETECPDKNCSETEFFCYKSRKCIDRQLVCDGTANCPQNEDEDVCYMVTPLNIEEIEVLFDIFERPLFSTKGNVAYNEKGIWKWLCVAPDENDPYYNSLLSNVSKQLGRKYSYDGIKQVFNDTLLSNNKSANTCAGLSVNYSLRMQIGDEVVLPWLAHIFVNGRLSCLGVLAIGNWIVADYNCCSNYNISHVDYIVVTLGTMRETSHIIRSYGEQIIDVDKLLYRPWFNVVLLHLKEEVQITERTKPLIVSTKLELPRGHEMCILIENNLQNSTVYELQLVKNCSSNKVCYTTQNKSKFCSNLQSISSYSAVLCVNQEEMWYLSSHVPSGDTTVCSRNDSILEFDPFPGMQNLDENEETVLGPSNNCDGYRCKLGNCNHWEQMCDGRMDCRQNEDERKPNCDIYQNVICKFKVKKCGCQVHEFRCKSGQCVSQKAICDGKKDCSDNSDEPASCSNFTCADYLNLTNPQKLCDAHQDCFDKTDEDINVCPSLCNFPTSFRCRKSNVCIPMDFVCDGERDCVQGEDEENCLSLKYTTDNSTVGTLWMQSNGKWRKECLSSDITFINVNALCNQFGFDHALHVETEPGSKHISTSFVTLKLNMNVEIVVNKKLQNKSVQTEQCNYLHLSCKHV